MWSVHHIILVIFYSSLFTTTKGRINEQITEATAYFTLDLLKTLFNQPGNAIVSPVSAYTLMAMLQQGARSDSRAALTRLLHADPHDVKTAYHNITSKYQETSSLTTMKLVNRVFVGTDHNIKPLYQQLLVSYFHSDIDTVNFSDKTAATDHINSWIAESTQNRYTHIFDQGSISSDTSLVLCNAIYFKSFWDFPFYDGIVDRPFSPKPNEVKQVPSMEQIAYYHGGTDADLGAKWIHMNFEDDSEYTVMLVLPTEKHGLDQMVNNLMAGSLITMLNFTSYKYVNLTLPRFSLNTDTDLIPPLRQLGLNDIFQDNADLSGISAQPLKVSTIVQKTQVSVDEDGVTASGATGMVAQPMSAQQFPESRDLQFTVDQPFLFFIVDRENALPLFAARISDPTSN